MNELEPELIPNAPIAHEDAVSAELSAWAVQRGFVLRQPNVLVVTKVRDVDGTLDVFKSAFPPRVVRQTVEPYLTRLPLRLELSWPDTAMLLDALRTSDAFDYEVNLQ